MPSTQETGPLPSSFDATTPAGPAAPPASSSAPAAGAALALAQASRALWSATLALMTAFMQQQAPAHRLLLARRISRNFDTLARQECFAAGCRASFARLAVRWHARAQQLSPESPPRPTSLLRALF